MSLEPSLLISKDFTLAGIGYFTNYLLMNMLISHIFAAFLFWMFALHFKRSWHVKPYTKSIKRSSLNLNPIDNETTKSDKMQRNISFFAVQRWAYRERDNMWTCLEMQISYCRVCVKMEEPEEGLLSNTVTLTATHLSEEWNLLKRDEEWSYSLLTPSLVKLLNWLQEESLFSHNAC